MSSSVIEIISGGMSGVGETHFVAYRIVFLPVYWWSCDKYFRRTVSKAPLSPFSNCRLSSCSKSLQVGNQCHHPLLVAESVTEKEGFLPGCR